MRILVYGDSNSWGFPPDGSGLRFERGTRWPGILADALGAEVIEDALPGRTTAHDDPELHGPAMNGLAQLPAALLAHSPLDWVLIMLGTNDFKARFSPGGEKIAANLLNLCDCVARHQCGPGPWDAGHGVRLAVILPPALPDVVDHSDFERHREWIGGRRASLDLARSFREQARGRDLLVFDAGSVVAGAETDPIHLTANSHNVLGRALASWLQNQDGYGEPFT